MQVNYIIREGIIHLRKIVMLIQKRGIMYVVYLLAAILVGYYYFRAFKSARTFTFQKMYYRYYYHHYNVTWMSERSVEIPIIRYIIEKYKGKRVLEIGNVLNHYFNFNHDIVDKYENGKNVVMQDVVDFRPKYSYDLIVSISTLEHIGWDEHLLYHTREPAKIVCTLDNLKRSLTQNGEMYMTYPVGYNPYLDRLTDNGGLKWTKLLCMKRISGDNAWVEVDWHDIKDSQYDNPFISANGLVVGYFKKNNNESKWVCS